MADQALEILAPNEVSNLDNLAKQIDAAHAAAQAALLTGVQKAIEAGQLLIQAKEEVPFGQWETWVKENTAVSPRTASAYLRIARHWTKADDTNRQRVADLTLRALLDELAGPSFQLPPARHRAPSDGTTIIVTGRKAETEPTEDPINLNEFAINVEPVEAEEETITINVKPVEAEEKTITVLTRKVPRIRDVYDTTPHQNENPIYRRSCDVEVNTSLRLIGEYDSETIARASKLDEAISLEDLSALLAAAAVEALK